jgi:predicted esterase
MPELRSVSLTVPRTARYAAFGPAPALAREWWIVIHGYGQLAADFLLQCRTLDDGSRLVVAPEALSRYYERGSATTPAEARVGASWMTREDRLNEISDYLRYFDLLVGFLGSGMPALPPIHVLGFSQGTAAASRWVAAGSVRAARLMCWGGLIAPELDLVSPAAPLRNTRVQLVLGTRDKFATPDVVAREEARLAAAGLVYEGITFEGGHRLDDATLAALAAG